MPQNAPWLRLFAWSLLATILMLASVQQVQAQQQYGQACSLNKPCAVGLLCLGTSPEQRCYFACNPLTPVCPNGEQCRVQPTGGAACYCTNDSHCPTGVACKQGLCDGPQTSGQECNSKKRCGPGTQCLQASGDTKTRCWPLCTGRLCTGGTPCVPRQPHSYCFCNKNEECPTRSCIQGQCQKPRIYQEECTLNAPCATGLLCVKTEEGTSRCLPDCRRSRCIGNERCQRVGSTGQACFCSSKTPCPTGTTCTNGQCNVGLRCTLNTTCPKGYHCYQPHLGQTSGVCVKACLPRSSSSCPNDTPCLPLPNRKYGCVCRRDTDCRSRRCRQYRCECRTSRDCNKLQQCNNGICAQKEQEPTNREPAQDASPDTSPETPVIPGPSPDTSTSSPSVCQPACTPPRQCIEGTCQKRQIGDECTKNMDCESAFCFGPSGLKICTESDCGRCPSRMSCQIFEGTQGCFFGETYKPPPPSGACGCHQSTSSPWMWLFFLCIFPIFWYRFRPTLSQHSPSSSSQG